MESALKMKAPPKEKKVRGPAKLIVLDPFQELDKLVAQAKGTSAGETARVENILANKQEDYEIAASADPSDAEKQKLSDAALSALMKVRRARVSSPELE